MSQAKYTYGANVDAAFTSVGSQDGVEIWRMENFQPVPVDEDSYGKFYSADSYIVLDTRNNRKEFHIHFWLGRETTQDKSTTAALKTIELGERLGGKAIHHRQVQDHENSNFLSLFQVFGGVQYLEGGTETALKQGKKEFENSMWRLRGKRDVRISQVEISSKHLNHADIFVVSTEEIIYQWNGRKANKMLKAQALTFINEMRDDSGATADIVILEDGRDDDNEDFWELLGGKGEIADASDSVDAELAAGIVSLYKVESDGSTTSFTSVPVKKESLNSRSVYVLDSSSEIFMWIGKLAPKDLKINSTQFALKYLEDNNKPTYLQVTTVIEFAETTAFKSKFPSWNVQFFVKDFTSHIKLNSLAEVKTAEVFDVTTIFQRRVEPEKKIDDGFGQCKVYRVEKVDMLELPQEKIGQFHSGSTYIIHYQFGVRYSKNIVYFWQGRDCLIDERAASALLTRDLGTTLQETMQTNQFRLIEGKETSHFLSIFGQKFVCLVGPHNTDMSEIKTKKRLIQVKHANNKTRATEIEPKVNLLNSGDSFVLVTPETLYVWHGKGSVPQEREYALALSETFKATQNVEIIEEGKETDKFWITLGVPSDLVELYSSMGIEMDAQYPTSPALQKGYEARLFQCSNVTGRFLVDEITHFSQDDLVDEDVMMLDAGSEIYVWVGTKSNEEEKAEAMEVARKYIDGHPDGDRKDTSIVIVEAGEEPAQFTCHFVAWEVGRDKALADAYEETLNTFLAQNYASKPEEKKSEEAVKEAVGALKKTGRRQSRSGTLLKLPKPHIQATSNNNNNNNDPINSTLTGLKVTGRRQSRKGSLLKVNRPVEDTSSPQQNNPFAITLRSTGRRTERGTLIKINQPPVVPKQEEDKPPTSESGGIARRRLQQFENSRPSGTNMCGFLTKEEKGNFLSGTKTTNLFFKINGTSLMSYEHAASSTVIDTLLLLNAQVSMPVTPGKFTLQVTAKNGKSLKLVAKTERDLRDWATALEAVIKK